tara:strand:- start:697 stop:978 length:282 start_codon:yes stop_codon:yes gene_type:complete
MNFFGYAEGDYIPCCMCHSPAVDIHHLAKRNKTKNDYIENLVALCRSCHITAESDGCFNMHVRIKHLENVCHQVYALVDLKKRLDANRNNKNK